MGETDDGPTASPYFSVVVPVYRTALSYLTDMINSVRSQVDADWELILIDDGSQDEELSAELAKVAAGDPRVRVETLPANNGIVAASERGRMLARGEFLCLLDHDDILDHQALAAVRKAVERRPDSDMLYSDETIIGPQGEELEEFTKPDFSPERLRGQMYTGHLSIYRRELLDRIGGFRTGFDGSQDYDLALRAAESARSVTHIRASLYRWRTLPNSVSHAEGNHDVFDAARRSIGEHLIRRGTAGRVVQTDASGRYRIDRDVPDDATATIVIPSNGTLTEVGRQLRPTLPETVRAIASRIGAVHPKVVVVAQGELDQDVLDQAMDAGSGTVEVIVLRISDGLGTRAVMSAIAAIETSFTAVLAEDAVPCTPRWLDRMIALAADSDIGVVHPRSVNRDGLIRSAGIAFTDGAPTAIATGRSVADPGPFGALLVNREVTAGSDDAFVIATDLLWQVGGLSPLMRLPAAVADLGMKAATLHRRAVVTPDVEVVLDRATRLPGGPDLVTFRARWGRLLQVDRYWPA